MPKNKKTTYYGNSRRDSLRQAKRDAGVLVTQHPEKVERRDLRDGFRDKVRDDTGIPIRAREYHYTSVTGKKFIIQENSLGYESATVGHGAEPHFNIRPVNGHGEVHETGSIDYTHGHYNF